ncbi:hypothetical protein CR62_24155 [Serratia grimesii]|uniref:Uncharacterized protein n=1 Tax=Serratia grimesii TaxID=82995 RepID=A0ABR4UAE8_9GAMM|nr:hypothetical protein CR62_24155 [Serratia grimesii]
MEMVKATHLEALNTAGIKIIESHIHASGGHIVIADVVHCSNGGGKEWREDRPLTLRSAESVFRYLDDIS